MKTITHTSLLAAVACAFSLLALLTHPSVAFAQQPHAAEADPKASSTDTSTPPPPDQRPSQSTPDDDELRTDHGDLFFSRSHRERMYLEARKSPSRALLYSLAAPGLGNIYAEQYFFAGITISLMAFTATFIAYGASTRQPAFIHYGLATGATAYTGGAISSYIGAVRFNQRLRANFNLTSASPPHFPPSTPTTLGWTFRF